MISNENLITYLSYTVNRVFKILPLYEEKSVGVITYVESLIFELDGLELRLDKEYTAEYESLMNTLSALQKEVAKVENGTHSIVKREVFKSIDIIKNIIEDGENHVKLY